MKLSHNELLEKVIPYTRHKYSELARELDISRQLINHWKQTNSIPAKYWPMLETVTGGKIKASRFKNSNRGNP
jgi:hypothetical protein